MGNFKKRLAHAGGIVLALLVAAIVGAITLLLTALDIGDKIGGPHRRYYAAALFVLFVGFVGAAISRLILRNEQTEQELRSQIETEAARKARTTEVRDGLGKLIGECRYYEKKYKEKDPADFGGEVIQLLNHGGFFLKNVVKDESFNHFYFTATEADVFLEEREMRHYDLRDDAYTKALRLLISKRIVFEKCLQHFPLT